MSNLEEQITRRYINSLDKDEILKLQKEFINDEVFYYYDSINREVALEFIDNDFSLFEQLSHHLEFSDIDNFLKTKPEKIKEYLYWLSDDIISNYSKDDILEFYKKYNEELPSRNFSKYFNDNLTLNEFTDEIAVYIVKSGSYINLDDTVIDYIKVRLNSDINLLPKFLPNGVHESLVYHFVNKDSEFSDKFTLNLMLELYYISPRYSFYYLSEALKFGMYEILNYTENYHQYLYSVEYCGGNINSLDINKLNFKVDIGRLVKQHKNLKYETVKEHISYLKYLKFKMGFCK